MTCVLKTSLEKRALVKISSILWSQSNIKAELDKILLFRSFDAENNFQEIEEKIMLKIEKNPELGKFKDKISGFVKSMGCQIFNWICYHSISNIAKEYIIRVHTPSFLWTPYGTIDKKETARTMIYDQTLDPATRYNLAHIYCLEGNVQEVWDNIPSDCKNPIYETRSNPGVINEFDLVFFWSNILGPNIVGEDTPISCKAAFKEAVQRANKVAAAYFLQKLSLEEKDICLVEVGQYVNDIEVLCFLMSQMDEEQRKRIFEINSIYILSKNYNWPWVTFYPEMANYYWQASTNKYSLFPLICFMRMLEHIGYEKVACQKIFTGLWQYVSKEFGADVSSSTNLLLSAVLAKNKTIIKMIFQDASPAIKKTFIEDSPVFIMRLIKEKDRELFQFLIQECLDSENEIKKFEKKLGGSVCLKRKSELKRRNKRL